jgi:hypothetical protein
MIDKLIEKYKETKIQESLILQDLEKLKKHQLEILNQTRRYLNSQKLTPEMVVLALRKIGISILGVDTDE